MGNVIPFKKLENQNNFRFELSIVPYANCNAVLSILGKTDTHIPLTLCDATFLLEIFRSSLEVSSYVSDFYCFSLLRIENQILLDLRIVNSVMIKFPLTQKDLKDLASVLTQAVSILSELRV